MTTKPNLTRVWAETAPGANVVDPDTVTVGKFTAGWQAEVPPFEYFNFIQKQVTEGLAHINEQGIAVWDQVTTYPVGGLAKGSDGNVYKALTSQNNNDPVSDGGTNWKQTIDSIFANVVAFGATGGNPSVDQAAFEAAAADGRSIYIPAPPSGQPYNLANWNPGPNKIVFGDGDDSKIILTAGNYGDTDEPNSVGALKPVNCPDLTIKDIHVDGNRSNVTGDDLLNLEAINVDACDRVAIINCTTVNTVADGIDIDNTADAYVSNCRGVDCGGYAVHHSIGSINPTTENCYAENCGFLRDRGAFDIFFLGTEGGKIMNNTAVNCNSGISVGPVTDSSIVTGNHIIDCEGDSIKVVNFVGQGQTGSGNSCLVSNNRVFNSLGRGIVVESNNVGVANNNITGGGGTASTTGLVIGGNKCRVIGNDVRFFSTNFDDNGTGTIDLGNNFVN